MLHYIRIVTMGHEAFTPITSTLFPKLTIPGNLSCIGLHPFYVYVLRLPGYHNITYQNYSWE